MAGNAIDECSRPLALSPVGRREPSRIGPSVESGQIFLRVDDQNFRNSFEYATVKKSSVLRVKPESAAKHYSMVSIIMQSPRISPRVNRRLPF